MSFPSEAELTDGETHRLRQLTERFSFEWKPVPFEQLRDFFIEYLPGPIDSLRTRALLHLILIDFRRRWLDGERMRLEDYLGLFPELGRAEDLPADTVWEEWRLRRSLRDSVKLDEYRRRFPRQFADLERLVSTHHDTTAPETEETIEASEGELELWDAGVAGSGTAVAPRNVPVPAWVAAGGGGFKILNSIGSGTYGEVWRAEAPGGVLVALKILKYPAGHQLSQQEHRSLELMKRLSHPYLIQLQSYWHEEGRLYMAMELADGSLEALDEKCRREGNDGIPLKELLLYFRQSAEALDYLHSEEVVHRDVKPANIMLVRGHAKIGDFGTARLRPKEAENTRATMLGTPCFMAPEIWRQEVIPQSDQYSLAAAYVELRLHRPLFRGESFAELAGMHAEVVPNLDPLPSAEKKVLLRALAKTPQQRYASCVEFVRELCVATGYPELASISRDLPKWITWVLGAAAALLLAVGILGFRIFNQTRPEEAIEATVQKLVADQHFQEAYKTVFRAPVEDELRKQLFVTIENDWNERSRRWLEPNSDRHEPSQPEMAMEDALQVLTIFSGSPAALRTLSAACDQIFDNAHHELEAADRAGRSPASVLAQMQKMRPELASIEEPAVALVARADVVILRALARGADQGPFHDSWQQVGSGLLESFPRELLPEKEWVLLHALRATHLGLRTPVSADQQLVASAQLRESVAQALGKLTEGTWESNQLETTVARTVRHLVRQVQDTPSDTFTAWTRLLDAENRRILVEAEAEWLLEQGEYLRLEQKLVEDRQSLGQPRLAELEVRAAVRNPVRTLGEGLTVLQERKDELTDAGGWETIGHDLRARLIMTPAAQIREEDWSVLLGCWRGVHERGADTSGHYAWLVAFRCLEDPARLASIRALLGDTPSHRPSTVADPLVAAVLLEADLQALLGEFLPTSPIADPTRSLSEDKEARMRAILRKRDELSAALANWEPASSSGDEVEYWKEYWAFLRGFVAINSSGASDNDIDAFVGTVQRIDGEAAGPSPRFFVGPRRTLAGEILARKVVEKFPKDDQLMNEGKATRGGNSAWLEAIHRLLESGRSPAGNLASALEWYHRGDKSTPRFPVDDLLSVEAQGELAAQGLLTTVLLVAADYFAGQPDGERDLERAIELYGRALDMREFSVATGSGTGRRERFQALILDPALECIHRLPERLLVARDGRSPEGSEALRREAARLWGAKTRLEEMNIRRDPDQKAIEQFVLVYGRANEVWPHAEVLKAEAEAIRRIRKLDIAHANRLYQISTQLMKLDESADAWKFRGDAFFLKARTLGTNDRDQKRDMLHKSMNAYDTALKAEHIRDREELRGPILLRQSSVQVELAFLERGSVAQELLEQAAQNAERAAKDGRIALPEEAYISWGNALEDIAHYALAGASLEEAEPYFEQASSHFEHAWEIAVEDKRPPVKALMSLARCRYRHAVRLYEHTRSQSVPDAGSIDSVRGLLDEPNSGVFNLLDKAREDAHEYAPEVGLWTSAALQLKYELDPSPDLLIQALEHARQGAVGMRELGDVQWVEYQLVVATCLRRSLVAADSASRDAVRDELRTALDTLVQATRSGDGVNLASMEQMVKLVWCAEPLDEPFEDSPWTRGAIATLGSGGSSNHSFSTTPQRVFLELIVSFRRYTKDALGVESARQQLEQLRRLQTEIAAMDEGSTKSLLRGLATAVQGGLSAMAIHEPSQDTLERAERARRSVRDGLALLGGYEPFPHRHDVLLFINVHFRTMLAQVSDKILQNAKKGTWTLDAGLRDTIARESRDSLDVLLRESVRIRRDLGEVPVNHALTLMRRLESL
jgi:hypothetical protein